MKWTDILKKWWQQQQAFLPELRAQAARYAPIDQASLLPERVMEESRPIFVLSTGRAGTQYLTELLNELPGLQAVHEPQPELLYASRWAYEHRGKTEMLEAAFLAARYEFIRNAHLSGLRYVETNNRLCFLADGIAKAFPKARFIHLIRHPEAFIRSGLQRKWYTDAHLTDEGRIQPPEELGLSHTSEKIAWLWNETNSSIASFGERVGSERYFQVRSEDLFEDIQVNRSLFSFMDEAYPGDERIRRAQNQPRNQSRKANSDLPLEGHWKEPLSFARSKGYTL